jgi:hypothetical protein
MGITLNQEHSQLRFSPVSIAMSIRGATCYSQIQVQLIKLLLHKTMKGFRKLIEGGYQDLHMIILVGCVVVRAETCSNDLELFHCDYRRKQFLTVSISMVSSPILHSPFVPY